MKAFLAKILSKVLSLALRLVRYSPAFRDLILTTIRSNKSAADLIMAISPALNFSSKTSSQPTHTSEFVVLSRMGKLPRVTVVIPIFNAATELAENLRTLVANLPEWSNVVLVDDCSTDPAVGQLLAAYAQKKNWSILTNASNLGFTASVNRGIRASDPFSDVVILNSDAKTHGSWLAKLRYAAYREPGIGTVTPLSDNAGVFSVPEPEVKNVPPREFSDGDMSRSVCQAGRGILLEVPTGNGFCMYVKRELLEDIQLFDEHAFPRGYGEENDFCMRAREAGWRNMVADSIFVGHVGSSSFKEERHELMQQGAKILGQRYPFYPQLVKRFWDGEFSEVRQRVALSLQFALPPKPRILFIQPIVGGGLPKTHSELVPHLVSNWDVFGVSLSGGEFVLSHFEGDSYIKLEEMGAPVVNPGEAKSYVFEEWLSRIIYKYSIEVVHIEHLQWASLESPKLLKSLGVRLTGSVHDFYTICPNTHLLDENETFCGGKCTPSGNTDCVSAVGQLVPMPPLKHAYVRVWQEEMASCLRYFDWLVAPSESALNRMVGIYPNLRDNLIVIPHGRKHIAYRKPTRPKGDVKKLALIGAIGPHKGSGMLSELVAPLRERGIELKLVGYSDKRLIGKIEATGEYSAEDLNSIVESEQFDAALFFSVCEETFSHTLTEAWMAGLPTISLATGALEERTTKTGNGFLLKPDIQKDPIKLADAICELLNDQASMTRCREQLAAWQDNDCAKSVSDMAIEYNSLIWT